MSKMELFILSTQDLDGVRDVAALQRRYPRVKFINHSRQSLKQRPAVNGQFVDPHCLRALDFSPVDGDGLFLEIGLVGRGIKSTTVSEGVKYSCPSTHGWSQVCHKRKATGLGAPAASRYSHWCTRHESNMRPPDS